MGPVIALACAAASGVSSSARDEVCQEFLTTLQDLYPGRKFDADARSASVPRIALTVTYATERGLGLEVAWLAGDGRRTDGLPLRTSFYDRPSDAELRRRFYLYFLQKNPLPF